MEPGTLLLCCIILLVLYWVSTTVHDLMYLLLFYCYVKIPWPRQLTEGRLYLGLWFQRGKIHHHLGKEVWQQAGLHNERALISNLKEWTRMSTWTWNLKVHPCDILHKVTHLLNLPKQQSVQESETVGDILFQILLSTTVMLLPAKFVKICHTLSKTHKYKSRFLKTVNEFCEGWFSNKV